VPCSARPGWRPGLRLGARRNPGPRAFTLQRCRIYRPQSAWRSFILRALPAQSILAGFLLAAQQHFDWVAMGSEPGMRILWLAALLATVVFAYFTTLILCGFRLADFSRTASLSRMLVYALFIPSMQVFA